jgi:hypothetical protein
MFANPFSYVRVANKVRFFIEKITKLKEDDKVRTKLMDELLNKL